MIGPDKTPTPAYRIKTWISIGTRPDPLLGLPHAQSGRKCIETDEEVWEGGTLIFSLEDFQ